MYKLISFLSFFYRQFILPNPLENLGFGVYLFFNSLFEYILYKFTFWTVSRFYESGSCPPLGSLLYLVFYYMHIMFFYDLFTCGLSILFIFKRFVPCLIIQFLGHFVYEWRVGV